MTSRLAMLVLSMAPLAATGASSPIRLDKAPVKLSDNASLQRGAKLFTSRCLACHSAEYMRYNRLRDIGMTAEQIGELLPEDIKAGSTMMAAMDISTARLAFGVPPPDLSVVARSRGPDWLYTYMRTFYVDESRAIGWNNAMFPSVGMPFVLSDLQGRQVLRTEVREGNEVTRLYLETPGSMSPAEFDAAMGDLTSYLVYMGDPSRMVRHRIGYFVLVFLLALFALVYALKREVWKDIS